MLFPGRRTIWNSLLSFAVASRLYDYRRPCMVPDNVLQIKSGRSVTCTVKIYQLLNSFNDSHPLVEQLADIFVPNDVHLVGSRGQVLGEEEKEAATPEIDYRQRTD